MEIRGESDELDPRLYAPDGDPWCRFGQGLACLNGIECKNESHRRYISVTGDEEK